MAKTKTKKNYFCKFIVLELFEKIKKLENNPSKVILKLLIHKCFLQERF